jgi:hypothetical protein
LQPTSFHKFEPAPEAKNCRANFAGKSSTNKSSRRLQNRRGGFRQKAALVICLSLHPAFLREKRDATMASVRRGRGPFWFYLF